jgi:Protein of unknown function (DUF2380)
LVLHHLQIGAPVNLFDHRPHAAGSIDRLWSRGAGVFVWGGLALAILVGPQSKAAEESTVKVAVFAFELADRSAGDGIIGQDAIDTENLKLSADEARQILSASGRYDIVDTSGVVKEVAALGGIQHCRGCEGMLAKKLGADLSMTGLVTRVNRTEYALQILVRDARSGAVVSNDFTGLRMGANYAWPRGTKWLMENKVLAARGRN